MSKMIDYWKYHVFLPNIGNQVLWLGFEHHERILGTVRTVDDAHIGRHLGDRSGDPEGFHEIPVSTGCETCHWAEYHTSIDLEVAYSPHHRRRLSPQI